MGFINPAKTTATINYDTIPGELKALPNWVCWAAAPDPKAHSGISKKPVNPKTGGLAESNNPSTWADFDTALNALYANPALAGLGFMFGGSGFFGVDIDDRAEELTAYLNSGSDNIFSEFLTALNSYAEISYSGNGIHIICRGKLPEGGRRSAKSKIEMYDSGRFFVMTGNVIDGYEKITDGGESIKPLHAKYFGKDKPQSRRPVTAEPILNINDIIRTAVNSKNGAAFSALLSGDISGYGSQSEADLAFCNMLAFWCGRDAGTMDIIFRSSGLMREKWDRKQSGTTYGALTIQKAIADCNEVYTPRKNDYRVNIGQSKKPVKLYSMDDMGNAARLVDMFGDRLRYCYTDKRWYCYDGVKWATDARGEVEKRGDEAIAAMKNEADFYAQNDKEEGTELLKQFEKHVKTSRSNRAKKAMLAEAQHHISILPSQMDTHTDALNTPAGVYSLTKGKMYPHKEEYYLTKSTAVSPSEGAACPVWNNFLNEIFCGDKDVIHYVQKAIGYSLSGSTKEQCAFFLYGTGRNGKSTFLEIVREMMGDYGANIQSETIMVKPASSSAINSDIARLKGARLVTSSEPNEGFRLNEGLIKQLTGGDTVTARKLYSDEFEFKPEFKLWFATNHKPIIRGTDTGIWRRIHMIPFDAKIPSEKVDKDLPQKLRAELPAILSWAIEGNRLWRAEGLKMPAAVLKMVREYRREMDVVSAFIDDCCILEGSVSAKTLYAAYCQWAEDNNEFKMSNTRFGTEISKRFEKVKGMKCNFYNGLSITSEY